MNKLHLMAMVAFFSFIALLSSAQNVVLINGQATEVILDGEAIETIVNSEVSDYLPEYGTLAHRDFKHVSLKHKEQTIIETTNANIKYHKRKSRHSSVAIDDSDLGKK